MNKVIVLSDRNNVETYELKTLNDTRAGKTYSCTEIDCKHIIIGIIINGNLVKIDSSKNLFDAQKLTSIESYLCSNGLSTDLLEDKHFSDYPRNLEFNDTQIIEDFGNYINITGQLFQPDGITPAGRTYIYLMRCGLFSTYEEFTKTGFNDSLVCEFVETDLDGFFTYRAKKGFNYAFEISGRMGSYNKFAVHKDASDNINYVLTDKNTYDDCYILLKLDVL